MKKLFLKSLVFCTFAFSMLSCNETMDMYGENGQGRGLVQRKNPIDYEQFALDLDSLGALYERDVIVFGVPDIEYPSVIRLTANVMRKIGEKERNNAFVLITSDGIEKDSINGIRGVIPGNNENISPGSHEFKKSDYPFLIDDVTINWSNLGVSVSMEEGYPVTVRNIQTIVHLNYISISGEICVHDEPFSPDPFSGTKPIHEEYGFSGMSHENESWEIHPYSSPYPTPSDSLSIHD